MSGDGDDFDWTDRDDIVVAHQGQIAVYLNPDGDVCLRQEGDWWRKDDAWIVIRPENVRKLVDAMLALVEPEAAPLALPAPMTPAERAKRYRHRKRHGSVTPPCDAQRDADMFEEVPASR